MSSMNQMSLLPFLSSLVVVAMTANSSLRLGKISLKLSHKLSLFFSWKMELMKYKPEPHISLVKGTCKGNERILKNQEFEGIA